MNITYQTLKPSHAKQYRQIRLESLKNFPDNFGSSYEEESMRDKLAFETYIEQQTKDKFIVGAFDGEALIGICGFAGDNNKKSRHRGTIIQMYVKPAYSCKGIGLQLLQTTIDEAFKIPGIEQLVLGVITSNDSANKIYEKAGFKEFGLHKNYFKEHGRYFSQRFMILYREETKNL